VVGEADTGAAGETVEHLTELVQQPAAAAMWRGRAAAPLSAVITVEDVGSTMVVAVVYRSSRFALL
jgi:hypothetical protein